MYAFSVFLTVPFRFCRIFLIMAVFFAPQISNKNILRRRSRTAEAEVEAKAIGTSSIFTIPVPTSVSR